MISKVDHVVLTTADMKACIAFYEKLGFKARDADGRWELFAGDFKINVHFLGCELEPKAQRVQPGSADLCFELNIPVERCQTSLLEQGIEVEVGVVARQGVRGVMQSLYVRDPDGNLIELCRYA